MTPRWRLCLFAALVVAALLAGSFALLRVGPPDRMLPAHATMAVPQSQYGGADYQWRSESELFLERSWVDTQFPRSGLFRYNVTTHTATEAPRFLAARPNRIGSSTSWMSPGGDWMLGYVEKGRLQNRGPFHYYTVGKTDGTRVLRRDVTDAFMECRWLADGRHWIELYGKHVFPASYFGPRTNMNGAPIQIQRIRICDVDGLSADRSIAVPLTSLLATPGIAWHMTAVAEDRFLNWQYIPPVCTPVTNPVLNPGRGLPTQIMIREIDARSPAPRHQYTVTLPAAMGVIQALFSPQHDRILWKLTETRPPSAINQLISEMVFRRRVMGIVRVSLWVSQLDGAGMHELGGVNNPGPPDMMSGPSDPETGEYVWGPDIPRRLRWSPDGGRISFAYNGALWTVPAGP